MGGRVSLQEGWIRADNLKSCLDLLGQVGEVELDEGIWDAFYGGLKDTDFEGNRWYGLPLGKLEVSIAKHEEGSGMLCVRVEAPHGFGRAVDVVLLTCFSYDLKGHP